MNRRVIVVLSVVAVLAAAAVGIYIFGGFGNHDNHAPNGYEITVWQDGAIAETVESDSYNTTGDTIDYHRQKPDANGKTSGQAKGTWVVKHKDWKPEPGDQKYKATLYSGTKVVGTWYVREFVTGERSVVLFLADGSEVLRVCGNLVIEELDARSPEDKTHSVTLSSGGQPVYTRELSWVNVVGYYVTGQPADGSGVIFIWGDYKVEEIKK